MSQPFFKMTGSGNDFVFIDGRDGGVEPWTPERIRVLCDRRTGIGADGLVVLTPEGSGGARMVYFNADGSRAGMCGNAALCSTRLAARLGFSDPAGMDLQTDSGLLRTRCVGPGWAAELRLPDFRLPEPMDLALLEREQWMDFVTVGVPHLIVLVEDLAQANVTGRGESLRRDRAFEPHGCNVNFVGRAVAGSDPVWQVRTYERGVEAETLACGTGTVGTAFALARRGLDRLPVRIRSWGGNVFSVAGRVETDGDGGVGWAREPWLCGEGRLVYEGRLV